MGAYTIPNNKGGAQPRQRKERTKNKGQKWLEIAGAKTEETGNDATGPAISRDPSTTTILDNTWEDDDDDYRPCPCTKSTTRDQQLQEQVRNFKITEVI